jgi:hypothetical protein
MFSAGNGIYKKSNTDIDICNGILLSAAENDQSFIKYGKISPAGFPNLGYDVYGCWIDFMLFP